ncbi:hypothetical protein ACT3TS_03005 [Specibacter sp. AOP5-B1-6]|uniref:hypothetical protein n=1 Tax=Specibacter sp. AOP5-B1-6 TaxID=3457653 RepID=UPI00402BCD4C
MTSTPDNPTPKDSLSLLPLDPPVEEFAGKGNLARFEDGNLTGQIVQWRSHPAREHPAALVPIP